MSTVAHAKRSVEKRTAFVPHLNEVELVERVRGGDAAARTAVVRRYHSALVHHAARIVGERGLAEDVVQDAWLAAFTCVNGFNPRSSLFAWLVRIVINRALGLRRREVRSLPFSACVTRTVGAGDDEELEFPGLACNDVSPERLLLEREALGRFSEALRALPESQRSVLLLRDFEGATAAETCRLLRINDLAHRVRLCRARASIRQALQSRGTVTHQSHAEKARRARTSGHPDLRALPRGARAPVCASSR